MEMTMRFSCSVWLFFALLAGSMAFASAPQVNSTNPVSAPTGTQVQINGSGFGATQGTSTVAFGNSNATVVTWSDTTITARVPATAITGSVCVTVAGVSSNRTVYFNVAPPQITSISPASGLIGTQVTVTGSGFQGTKGANSSITFNGVTATVVTWNDSQIVATVPAQARTGAVQVIVNDIGSN